MPGSYRPNKYLYILYNNLFILHLRSNYLKVIKHNKIKYQILNGQNNKQNDKYIYRTLHYQSTPSDLQKYIFANHNIDNKILI